MNKRLSHIDDNGDAKMVDVSSKPLQLRIARAGCTIYCATSTITLLKNKKIPKGDVFAASRIAGIMAAKQTSQIIPLCHPLFLSTVEVEFEVKKSNIYIKSRVQCEGKTGVEMEALTAVSVAALTIYDMCKAVDKTMVISDIRLVGKIKK